MITVTVSTSSNPSSSGSQDHTINLSTGDTLPQNIPLYAYAQDSGDPTAILSYSWYLLRSPTGSSAALSVNNIESPTLEDVDIWGDYRLFCIAANAATGETSETDPIKAPNEAFTQVRVRSANLALVKPAPGERDWFSYAYEWVSALDGLDPLIDGHETRITTLEGATPTTTFSALTDTNFTGLVDGQVAQYQSGAWVNQTISTTVDPLSISAPTSGSIDLATQSLAIAGTVSEIEVTGVATSGYTFTIGLPAQVIIADTLQVGGLLTALDELTVTNSLNALSDIYVTGSIKDAVSPYAYLVGKVDGWYMSDDGQATSECKLMTRCTVPSTSTSTRGGVMTSTDKWSSYNSTGKLPSVHILTYSMAVEHTIYTNSAGDPNVDHMDDNINANQTGSSQITPEEMVLFYNASGGDIQIEDISIVVMAGGDVQGQPYIFELTYYTDVTKLKTLVQTATGITLTASQSSAWLPAVAEATQVAQAIPNNGYFGIRINQESKIPGNRLIVNITAIRLL
jgi:hypothetical protein